MEDIKKENKEKQLSFLEGGNCVTLSGGKVFFGSFKNWQRNDAQLRALNDKRIMSISDKEYRDIVISSRTNEWLISWIIFNSNSYLKKDTIENTFRSIQELNENDSEMLGISVAEFILLKREELKKKSL